MAEQAQNTVVRFGVYEVNLRSGELRKHGLRIRLPGQPLRILTILLEQPGQVVTREELQKSLWPDDTFVDFEHSLNSAIKKLRSALGDSAESPRYIETLPRLGSRFVAPVTAGGLAAIGEMALTHAETVLEPSEGFRMRPQVETLPGSDASPASLAPLPANPDIRPLARPNRLAKETPLSRPPMRFGVLALVGLLLLAAAYFASRHFYIQPVSTRKIIRVAVLPLENLSHDSEQEYFADGITDELITDLARFTSIEIISRTSVMRYKGTQKTLAEIARELGADAVVEGTVAHSGNRVRITAQLVDARTDRHLWANAYEDDLTDILNVQSKVARNVAEGVRARLTTRERALVTHAPTVSPQAYEYYLRGLYFEYQFTSEGRRRAIEFYHKALRLSPAFASAHVGLANTYSDSAAFQEAPTEFALKAEEEALEALREDPAVADARFRLAYIYASYEWKWADAESEFQRGLELSPNAANGHLLYAFYLVALGRFEQAITEVTRARELDPLSPHVNYSLGEIYYLAHMNDRAIEQLQRTREMFPDFAIVHEGLARAYFESGRLQEAVAEDQADADNPSSARAIAQAFATSGYPGVLRWHLDDLRRKALRQYVGPVSLAWHYAILNDQNKAMEWLEKAYAEHDNALFLVNVLPGFDTLHSAPHYKDLIRRIGLPTAAR